MVACPTPPHSRRSAVSGWKSRVLASAGETWQVGVLRIELEEDVPVLCARGGLVCVGGAEFREQLAAAVDADLVEDGL
jgi:hypothetical protein